MGVGIQNLTRVFLILACRADSSKDHDVCSLAEGPAVGSAIRLMRKTSFFVIHTALFFFHFAS